MQLSSSHFDTLLFIVTPSGLRYENDDIIRGVNTNSRLELALRESGEFFVAVTSCIEAQTGSYALMYEPGVRRRGPSPTNPKITELKQGKTTGNLTLKDNRYELRRADFYRFEAKFNQYCDISVK